MNFEKWYKNFWGGMTSTHQEDASKIAWEACKEEVLKILYSKKTMANVVSPHLMNPDYQIDNAIQEIENL